MRRHRRAATIRPVTARRPGSPLTLLAFGFALLLKGAIPLLASWSAQLQGKSVAEVCDVYGVELPGRGAHDGHAMHRVHAMHGATETREHARQWSAAAGIDNLNNYAYWNFHPYPQRSYTAELKFDL